jgi:hypothetical protein
MALAEAGIRVDLYDKNDRCMSQASAQNEGKIHLGYVYANDRSLRSARTMVRGAIAFAPLLRRWLGSGVDRLPVSTTFHYAVHRDSLLTVEEIALHLRQTHALAVEESSGRRVDYFGADYRAPPERMDERACRGLFDGDTVAAAFRTEEVGIDPEALAGLIRARLAADPLIRCRLNAYVHAVCPHNGNGTLDVDVDVSGCRMREPYDHVVNALWDGRLAVDRTAGVRHSAPWLFRVKHYLRVTAPAVTAHIPSTTIVLGPFGDVVAYRGGDLYLSWYPAGLRGSSSDLTPPSWPLVLDQSAADDMRCRILEGLRRSIPSLGLLTDEVIECWRVNAGIIFAWGSGDISDPASRLHERHVIGPLSRERYHTVDTGKLTTAPYFGQMVAGRIRDGR